MTELVECCICYSTTEKDNTIIKSFCNKCKITVCSDCWYAKCRSHCPICDRDALNTQIPCCYCEKFFHRKDIDRCTLCNKMVCQSCESQDIHGCSILIEMMTEHASLGVFETLDDIEKALLEKYDEQFYLIGYIQDEFLLVKDYDFNENSRLSLLRVIHSKTSSIRELETYKVGNFSMNYISFSTSYDCLVWIKQNIL